MMHRKQRKYEQTIGNLVAFKRLFSSDLKENALDLRFKHSARFDVQLQFQIVSRLIHLSVHAGKKESREKTKPDIASPFFFSSSS